MSDGNGHRSNGRAGGSPYHLDTEVAFAGSGTPPWPDARRQPLPHLRESITGRERHSIAVRDFHDRLFTIGPVPAGMLATAFAESR
jgi:hypothetical protein